MSSFHNLLVIALICAPRVESANHIQAALSACSQAKAELSADHFQQAAALFESAIRIEPTFEVAYRGLIQAHLKSGKPLEAAAALTRLIEIEPNVVQYRVQLGEILLELNQPQRALAQFAYALKLDPFHREALLGFASAAMYTGLSDRAAKVLERGRLRYPDDKRFNKIQPSPRISQESGSGQLK